MKDLSLWRRCKAHLDGTRAAAQDTPSGRKEGLHEARALKDHRVRDFTARWSRKKAA